ncbi:MAG TPA: THUMP domain-containing protein [Gemmatimonadaceae bacterium]|nr:THUMP domain-containing protein [Gemmatimonadaceae bacterium]
MPATPRHAAFAITAPGLEALTAAELHAIGLPPSGTEPGGVAFVADVAGLCAANLRLRTASRVVVRVAEFTVVAFRELERHAARVPWERFVAPGRAVAFRVTCRKSRLYHSDAVAQRLALAVTRRVGGAQVVADAGESEGGEEDGARIPPQLFVVRLLHDRCTISADTSGPLLHRRGYRQAVAKAPLRETLAAAMLLGAGWRPDAPLVDPMCGSGTIAIEGALLARRIAPGLQRDFALRHWPEHDDGAWRAEHARAAGEALSRAPAPIVAADRDAGAVAATEANARRAGVLDDLAIARQPLSALEPPAGAGWLVTNPPYGARIGARDPLRDLYARLGQLARTRLGGWTVALLSADARLEAQVGLRFEEGFRTTNGGIRVRLVRAAVPAPSAAS